VAFFGKGSGRKGQVRVPAYTLHGHGRQIPDFREIQDTSHELVTAGLAIGDLVVAQSLGSGLTMAIFVAETIPSLSTAFLHSLTAPRTLFGLSPTSLPRQ